MFQDIYNEKQHSVDLEIALPILKCPYPPQSTYLVARNKSLEVACQSDIFLNSY